MKQGFWAVVPLVCWFGSAPSQAQSTYKMSINGASVSTKARVIGGVTYVPVGDVAKALGMKATVSGTTISMKPAGGTFQVANKLKGNQGEDLFSGRFGFKVLSVERGASYAAQFSNRYNRDTKYEAEDGEELVIVKCRLKNGTTKKQNFAFPTGAGASYGMNTALTDSSANSYAPDAYDVFAEEGSPLGKSALPGASIPFNIVFRASKGAALKDLVYSVVLYNERGDSKSTDFRIALAAPVKPQ